MKEDKNIKNTEPLYRSVAGENSVESHTLPEYCSVVRGIKQSSVASRSNNLKSGHNRYDTDFHRPEDRIPTRHKEIIKMCQGIYKRVGVVRNIIDLMSDFGSEGLTLNHPIKRQERFYRAWAEKVDLENRAHDFMKLLIRDANVILRRKNAFLTLPVAQEMSKAFYDNIPPINNVDERKFRETPEKIHKNKKTQNKRVIPWKYTFISPVVVDKIGGDVGRFVGGERLGFRLSPQLSSSIENPKTDAEKALIKSLPAEVVAAARNGSNFIALDPDKVYVDYYKKDDWEDWGTPFLYGVIEDILLKDKMKQADMAALDGVINIIRLWKLGRADKDIMPTPAAVDKFIGILEHNVGGGAMDIVWDDMIDFQVEYPPTDKILGDAKYKSVDRDIIKGMGIPESLIGGAELGTRNAQSAFVQLKTLVERLEYVRSRCIKWMENELKLVAEAMGFQEIPSISFGVMSLRDEAAEKQLMIQLLDRNVISIETIHEAFGQNFVIELERLKSEQLTRDGFEPLIEKAGPYYRPKSILDKQEETQLAIQDAKTGENQAGDLPKNESVNGPGRPPNTKDTAPRDERTEKTLSFKKIIAEKILIKIDEVVDPLFLSKNNVKNIRSLSKDKKDLLENIKFSILASVNSLDDITRESMFNLLNKNNANIVVNKFNKMLKSLINDFISEVDENISVNDKRSLACFAWAILKGELKNVND